MKPYGLCADIHLHSWSAFSTALHDGINSRLGMLLGEIERCAKEVKQAGGDMMIVAGDIFHVRGSVAPLVLNPTIDCIKKIIESGVKVVLLAGNHDAELKDVTRLSSAITALEGVGCTVVNSATTGLRIMERVVLIPWTNKIDDLKVAIEAARNSDPNPAEVDLILHAPIAGVIPGIPDHGLTGEHLQKLGFRRVFAGHYHHHKEVVENVYSIGALAQHTWGDIGSKAGFLVVGDDVKWFKSRAPEFIEIGADNDPAEIPLLVDGHYVRAKISTTKQKDVEDLRAYLTDCGAKGVVILAQKEASVAARSGSTVASGASLEVSIVDFIKGQSYGRPEDLGRLCHDILTEAKEMA